MKSCRPFAIYIWCILLTTITHAATEYMFEEKLFSLTLPDVFEKRYKLEREDSKQNLAEFYATMPDGEEITVRVKLAGIRKKDLGGEVNNDTVWQFPFIKGRGPVEISQLDWKGLPVETGLYHIGETEISSLSMVLVPTFPETVAVIVHGPIAHESRMRRLLKPMVTAIAGPASVDELKAQVKKDTETFGPYTMLAKTGDVSLLTPQNTDRRTRAVGLIVFAAFLCVIGGPVLCGLFLYKRIHKRGPKPITRAQ